MTCYDRHHDDLHDLYGIHNDLMRYAPFTGNDGNDDNDGDDGHEKWAQVIFVVWALQGLGNFFFSYSHFSLTITYYAFGNNDNDGARAYWAVLPLLFGECA